jgi:hypothetical protein
MVCPVVGQGWLVLMSIIRPPAAAVSEPGFERGCDGCLDGFLLDGGAGGGEDHAGRVLTLFVEGRGEWAGDGAEREEAGDLLARVVEVDPEGSPVEVVG